VIAVEGEEGISRGSRRPSDVYRMTVSPNVKHYPCLGGSQVKAFVRGINNDWRASPDALAAVPGISSGAIDRAGLGKSLFRGDTNKKRQGAAKYHQYCKGVEKGIVRANRGTLTA
jgi:hypothetical protein